MKTAIDYLNEYGVPWRYFLDSIVIDPPTWDGGFLTLSWQPGRDSLPSSIEWAFHEISHQLFAPSSSISLPNYGLGSDPADGGLTREVVGASRSGNVDTDEAAVCILDIILMLKHELSEKHIRHHAENYNIYSLNERDIELLGQIGFSRETVEKVRPFLI